MLNFKNINRFTLVLFIGLLIISTFISISVFVFILVLLCWLIVTIIGSFNITWNYHLNAYNFNKTCNKKQVAITFDDGPNAEFTPQILDLLRAYHAKATFFCIGKNVKQQPKLVQQIIAEGHTVGNHSYSHSKIFDFYGKQKVITEIETTNALVASIINKEMALFRPPYGVTNPAITKAIKHTKHKIIGWNIRSLDTVKDNEQNILNRITKNITPGAVILLHDSQNITVRVLEQLLLFLQENNYQSVTVDTLFNIEAYA
ncbi:polysaccharide deacetylase family protein [Winogradskyella thalassocola]|uniref:Peptidoglycan/xylan/chitin deacetylase, PgdA/CDA1 family n=1 Tax=Winogradskyella thalassocola TaxID=262004 RepID=A0A1G7VZM7_9FLAO|nr:polysaccharide deacetylase family protein [Winogradskyella thalassocola]SDG65197.1 Peptidoglycan/xylan/chitin deacetylase, PgdA/CDA1 family [Winogradskyella thalassocola]